MFSCAIHARAEEHKPEGGHSAVKANYFNSLSSLSMSFFLPFTFFLLCLLLLASCIFGCWCHVCVENRARTITAEQLSFLWIEEGPTLTVTCTVLTWWGNVLSVTRDALKSSWNWSGSTRSSISLGSRMIWSGAGNTIWLVLDDDPTILYFGRAWHGRIPPAANLTNSVPRGRSWVRLFSDLRFVAVRFHRHGDVNVTSPCKEFSLRRIRLWTTVLMPAEWFRVRLR